jgi:hypothetical protein
MKILTAHQPAYMPWLGYFHKIGLADEFVLLDEVQFEKNSFTNRNKIKTANGEAWLTIPLEMKGHIGRNINEMRIDENSDWRKKHWNSLFLSYKKAPFFSHYSDFFETYYKNTTTSVLTEFIKVSSDFFFKELNILLKMEELSKLGITSKKQELIMDLCKKTGSDVFVFGSQGKDYADIEFFKSQAIKCFFQEYKHPEYNQLWGEFKPYMCILDCLFNLGAERTAEIIFENNLTPQELKGIL